jgi:hypothetical protein
MLRRTLDNPPEAGKLRRCGIIGLSASGGLSQRVNKMAGFSLFVDVTRSEPIKGAHSPQLAEGLASVYKISPIPYGEDSP